MTFLINDNSYTFRKLINRWSRTIPDPVESGKFIFIQVQFTYSLRNYSSIHLGTCHTYTPAGENKAGQYFGYKMYIKVFFLILAQKIL